MAKIVCKNCGQKNPSSAAACSNCGNFLIDEPMQAAKAPVQAIQEENLPQDSPSEQVNQEVETRPYEGRVETINISGGKSSQWLGMGSGFAILAVFIGLEYSGVSLPSYSTYAFLALIFVLPSLLRRFTQAIKFNSTGFTIPKSNPPASFEFENIMNVKLGPYDRRDQSLTIYFKEEIPAVRMDFSSMFNFRNFVMMLSKRRIPIVPQNSPTEDAGQTPN